MKKTNQIKLLLLLGILLVVLSPFFFTRSLGWLDFTQSGQIGDTIGGITAPVVNLIGAILVYYALNAQIEANRIIQEQIDDQKKDNDETKRLKYINTLFLNFKEDVDSFHYSEKVRLRNSTGAFESINNHQGGIAISKFLDNIKFYADDPHDESTTHKYPQLREFIGIIELGNILIDKIYTEKIKNEDKKFYFEYLKHYLDFKIWPMFGEVSKNLIKQGACEQCGKAHGKYPSSFIIQCIILKKVSINIQKHLRHETSHHTPLTPPNRMLKP